MGEWDGYLNNGEEVISGTYVFIASYFVPNEIKIQSLVGNIILIK